MENGSSGFPCSPLGSSQVVPCQLLSSSVCSPHPLQNAVFCPEKPQLIPPPISIACMFSPACANELQCDQLWRKEKSLCVLMWGVFPGDYISWKSLGTRERNQAEWIQAHSVWKIQFFFYFLHWTVEFHIFSPMYRCTTRASSAIQGFVHKGVFGTRTK